MATLEQSGFETAATIRRAFASFNHEVEEFAFAAASGQTAQMETARRLAHEHLDACFDGIAAGHAIGRSGNQR